MTKQWRRLRLLLACSAFLSLLTSILVHGQDREKAPESNLPSLEELRERFEEAWQPLRLEMRARMIVERPGGQRGEFDVLIRRGGPTKVRIDFLPPERDRGKVILRSGDETWLYLPRARKVVAISPSRSPLAGGVMLEDLFPEDLEGYEVTIVRLQEAIGLELKPRRRGLSPGRLFFDKTTLLPVRRDVYSPSGRPLRSIVVEETREWQGRQVPAKLRVVDEIRKGYVVRIEVVEFHELPEGSGELFDRDALGKESTKDEGRAPGEP